MSNSSNPYHFGCGTGKMSDAKLIAEIAVRHGATFINENMPEGWRYWFSCDEHPPFTDPIIAGIKADLAAAHIHVPAFEGHS